MIHRISDEMFNDDIITRLANNMQKSKHKLFSIVKTEDEAKQVANELTITGYHATYNKSNGYYNVYYATKATKLKVNDQMLNNLQQVDDNKYRAYKKTAEGVYDYNFDDGAIWSLQMGEDGQQYLVKEIKGDDENDVVRTKKAAKNNIINNKDLNSVIAEILKSNNLISSPELINNINEKIVANLLDKKAMTDFIIKTANQNVKEQC